MDAQAQMWQQLQYLSVNLDIKNLFLITNLTQENLIANLSILQLELLSGK